MPDRRGELIVEPGQPLGYMEELRRRNLWPPSRAARHYDGPTATPFLVVPADGNDAGARPLTSSGVLRSQAIQLVDPWGNVGMSPDNGVSYRVRCQVTNLGVAPSYGALAHFYVASPVDVDAAASTPGTLLPALGHAAFIARPTGTVAVECPNQWTPQSADELAASIVVHAHDPFVDPLKAPYDARADRHVGRYDFVPDFAGTWDGTVAIVGGVGSYQQRVVVTQAGLSVTAAFSTQVGGALPANPQVTATGSIAGQQAVIDGDELAGGVPFTSNHWVLSLPDPGTLHIELHRKYVRPGDNRSDQDLISTLHHA
jgi:hypothetical protein